MILIASKFSWTGKALGSVLASVIAAAPAFADWRGETGTFRVGIVARADRGGASVDYSPAAKALSTAIGMPVEIVPMIDYPALIEAQTSSRIEYAVYSATAFATAVSLCKCIVPLAAPVAESGEKSAVAIAVTTNKEIKSLDDVGQGRLAWPRDGDASVAAFQKALTIQGRAIAGDEKFVRPVSSPEEALAALKKGKADTMIGWAYARPDGTPLEGSGSLAALADEKVDASVIWTSRPLRFGPHAVRKDVPMDIRTALTTFLVSELPKVPEIAELLDESFLGRFEPVAETDYADAIAEAESLKPAPAK